MHSPGNFSVSSLPTRLDRPGAKEPAGRVNGNGSPGAVSRRFADCDQLGELLHGVSGEYLQIGAGDCRGDLTRIDLGGLSLLITDISNRTLFRGGTDAAHRLISVPLHCSGPLQLDGESFERPRPVYWQNGRHFVRVGEEVRMATFIYEEGFHRECIAAWTGGAPDRWDTLADRMLPNTAATRQFVSAVREFLAEPIGWPQQIVLPGAVEKRVDRLFARFALAVESGGEVPDAAHRRLIRENHIVRQVADYLDAHLDREVSLLDLCRLTGRSARMIEYAFKRVTGMGPMRYLKHLRLTRARALLRESTPDERNVSECGYAAGFNHLGRFSSEYRELYSERPSETLRGVRSSVTGLRNLDRNPW